MKSVNLPMTSTENPLEGIFLLPGGFFQSGTCFREVKLRPPTGRVEEQLGDASNARCLASAITTLLTHCIERIGPINNVTAEIVRDLLVGDRDYLVLKLRQITIGDRVEATLLCPNSQCGEKFDIDFDLTQIPIQQGNISSQVFAVKVPERKTSEDDDGDRYFEVEFRLPNGRDQEELAFLIAGSESEAANKLLRSCIQRIDGIKEAQFAELSSVARGKIESTMAEIAPQIDLEMEAICPECEKVFSFMFNIAQLFLDEIKLNLNQLYKEVHLLAFYYKWSESEILSMTRKKRRSYLELLSEHLEQGKLSFAQSY